MTIAHQTPAFATLVGSPQEVKSRLEKSAAEQVIVLPVPKGGTQHAGMLAQALSSIATFLDEALGAQSEQPLKALVNAVVPKVPPTPALIKEAAGIARARKAVLEGGTGSPPRRWRSWRA